MDKDDFPHTGLVTVKGSSLYLKRGTRQFYTESMPILGEDKNRVLLNLFVER